MNCYAQTNLQLYGQLLRAGRTEAELRLVRDAYELAVPLCAGLVRASGKPFLAHLVGVASILAAHGDAIETITAGLLHSVYWLGKYGDGSRSLDARQRREVRRLIGPAVDDLVAEYGATDWRLSTLRSIQPRLLALTPRERSVLEIKMADVLEDHLDQALEYTPAKRLADGADNRAWIEVLVDLARSMGRSEIADELQSIIAQPARLQIPEYLINSRSGSILIGPRSHRKRIASLVGRMLTGWFTAKKSRTTTTEQRIDGLLSGQAGPPPAKPNEPGIIRRATIEHGAAA